MGAEGRRVTRNNEMANFLVSEAVLSNLTLLSPRRSNSGMPSRSEGWGGAEREPDRAKQQELFKDEQYQLIRSASRAFIRWLRIFEQTTPALRARPSLLMRGIAPYHTLYHLISCQSTNWPNSAAMTCERYVSVAM